VKTTITLDATDGAARAGRVHTARGTFVTPCFMPVGTRGAVRHLSAGDLELLGADVMLGNTYHLMLRPGVETIEALGGLHHFTDWDGHILTDSGGYQIFSLAPKVDDDGALFRSVYDGSSHRLTPEGAVDVQRRLGADIQMVLDVCPPAKSAPAAGQAPAQAPGKVAPADAARRQYRAAPVTNVTVDGNEAMFTTMCALLAAGFESNVSAENWSPMRSQLPSARACTCGTCGTATP